MTEGPAHKVGDHVASVEGLRKTHNIDLSHSNSFPRSSLLETHATLDALTTLLLLLLLPLRPAL
jgi:hypothetical protein